jgi:hypothetical protein
MKNIRQLLHQRREEILSRFDTAVRGPVGVEDMKTSQLRDSLPEWLDQVAAAAQGEPARAATAREHGRQRFRLGFRAHEVVREYGILCSVILELASEEGVELTRKEIAFLTTALFEAGASAVAEYAAQRDHAQATLNAKHLAFVAHELRDPLHTARLALALVRRGSRREHALDTLGRSIERVADLVDNTLLASRLDAHPPLQIEPVHIEPLLRSVAADCEMLASDRGIDMQIDAERPLALEGDLRLLRSTVTNLARNAVKFSHPNSTIVLRGRGTEGRVRIEVEDSCGGLPPEQMQRIFEPFVQGSPDRTGFGLGLAIARQATHAHGGTLTVHNIPGKGCVFVLDLPVVPAEALINPEK